jgi:hypothetical protein
MRYTRIMAIALASSSLAAAPADAGGLLGGGAANCLCNAVGGVLGSGAPGAPHIGSPGGLIRGTGSGLSRQGSIAGSVSNSVNGTLGVTTSRSINRRNGQVNGNVGLAGTVSNVTNATLGAQGLGRSVGLAGSSSTNGSVNKQVGVGLAGIGTNQLRSVAGHAAGSVNAVIGSSRDMAQGGSASLAGTVNGTANAVLAKSHGGDQGSGSQSLSGTLSSTSNGALAITKSHGGSGNSSGAGNEGPGLPNGIRLINGIPCLPDGTPLTGAAAERAMAALANGANGHSGGSSNSGGSQRSSAAGRDGNSRQSEMADRKDLWWSPHSTQQSRDGRLNDH